MPGSLKSPARWAPPFTKGESPLPILPFLKGVSEGRGISGKGGASELSSCVMICYNKNRIKISGKLIVKE